MDQSCALRRPCGRFGSWRRLGWDPQPDRLLENARPVADHLRQFTELSRSATGFEPHRSRPA